MDTVRLADMITEIIDDHKYEHSQTCEIMSAKQFGSSILVETLRSCESKKFIVKVEEA